MGMRKDKKKCDERKLEREVQKRTHTTYGGGVAQFEQALKSVQSQLRVKQTALCEKKCAIVDDTRAYSKKRLDNIYVRFNRRHPTTYENEKKGPQAKTVDMKKKELRSIIETANKEVVEKITKEMKGAKPPDFKKLKLKVSDLRVKGESKINSTDKEKKREKELYSVARELDKVELKMLKDIKKLEEKMAKSKKKVFGFVDGKAKTVDKKSIKLDKDIKGEEKKNAKKKK